MFGDKCIKFKTQVTEENLKSLQFTGGKVIRNVTVLGKLESVPFKYEDI